MLSGIVLGQVRNTPRVTRLGRSRAARGFSLVELMVVVAMVGILAVIAIGSFRSHALSSRSVEVSATVQAIRAAQESYYAENKAYLDVSTSMTAWYPSASIGTTKWAWVQSHTDRARWALLAPNVPGDVQAGYTTKAGPAQSIPTALEGLSAAPTFTTRAKPWYVIQARADFDGDGEYAMYAATSFTGSVYSERDGE